MSIERRGDGEYRFRVQHKKINYSMTFNGTEPQAKKAHANFAADVKSGKVGTNENMLFRDLVDKVIETIRPPLRAANTFRIYTNHYKIYLLPTFGKMRLSTITPYHIQIFHDRLAKQYSVHHVSSVMRVLRTTFSRGVEWRIIQYNPVEFRRAIVDKEKEAQAKSNFYPEKYIPPLLKAMYEEKNLRHRAIMFLIAGCGFRNGELCAINLKNIDHQTKSIKINEQVAFVLDADGKYKIDVTNQLKTVNSYREESLPEIVYEVLMDYIRSLGFIPKQGYIFWNFEKDKPLDKTALRKRFKYFFETNHLPYLTPHQMRKFHGTLLVAGGVDVKTAATRMGHTEGMLLSTYAKPMRSKDISAADTVNTYFKEMIGIDPWKQKKTP